MAASAFRKRDIVTQILTDRSGALWNIGDDLAWVITRYGDKIAGTDNLLWAIRSSTTGKAVIRGLIAKARATAGATGSFAEFMSAICLNWTDALRTFESMYVKTNTPSERARARAQVAADPSSGAIVADFRALRRELQMKDAPHVEEGKTLIHLLADLYGEVKHGKAFKDASRPPCGSDDNVLFRQVGHGCRVVQTDFAGCSVKPHAFPGCFIKRDLAERESIPAGCNVLGVPKLAASVPKTASFAAAGMSDEDVLLALASAEHDPLYFK